MGHTKKNTSGGSSHDRRTDRRHDQKLTPSQSAPIEAGAIEPKPEFIPLRQQKQEEAESKQRLNELLNLASFALGLASWGWTVVAPESSATFGSALLFLAVVFALIGVLRIWPFGKILFALLASVLVVGFGAFDWYVVIKPQRGKPFRELLLEGYHLTNECEAIPAKTETPSWIRDQSTGWQARTQAMIFDKLNPEDIQVWKDSIIIGRVKDTNLNAYQCLWLANKVSALETIIAEKYDPKLKHRDYKGPTYWFDTTNGQVDISEFLKSGNKDARMYFNGDGSSDMIKITGNANSTSEKGK
jgi:hypothetical protein